jgi:hypothetical protein
MHEALGSSPGTTKNGLRKLTKQWEKSDIIKCE